LAKDPATSPSGDKKLNLTFLAGTILAGIGAALMTMSDPDSNSYSVLKMENGDQSVPEVKSNEGSRSPGTT